jgi:hypothetical protein
LGIERSSEARALTQTVFCPAWLTTVGKSDEFNTRCRSKTMKCIRAVSFIQLSKSYTIFILFYIKDVIEKYHGILQLNGWPPK